MTGRFITLEGGEGAGKTTLLTGLAARLTTAQRAVICTREPGGTAGADEIRALLVTGGAERWSALTEALLFTAARCDHIERVIRPALGRGDWVICDRFVDSTRAYQSAADGVPEATLDTLAQLIGAPAPDLTFILDIDPRAGLARARSRAQGEARYEDRDITYHERVRAAFLEIARLNPHRCRVLDAAAPPEEVLAKALAAIEGAFGAAA